MYIFVKKINKIQLFYILAEWKEFYGVEDVRFFC